ncbi:DUF983 domain-containing protein [Limibacter armeniacum]|uniref:DUF983 domain-containing protein n=1 Tax=Limibacter armeniacum TaxID=466084 RepID=UPI002FE62798
MHKNCPKCGGNLSPEPGFYFGASYVSYGVNVAIMIAFFVATYVLYDPKEVWVYFLVIFPPIFILLPVNFRISRSIYLHLFGGVDYDPDLAKQNPTSNENKA